MKRRDERKSENVRSLDIAHEAAAEGLACVGEVKTPTYALCSALMVQEPVCLPHTLLRPSAEARSLFIMHAEIFTGAWKIILQHLDQHMVD